MLSARLHRSRTRNLRIVSERFGLDPVLRVAVPGRRATCSHQHRHAYDHAVDVSMQPPFVDNVSKPLYAVTSHGTDEERMGLAPNPKVIGSHY
jgi:hypothetical protein